MAATSKPQLAFEGFETGKIGYGPGVFKAGFEANLKYLKELDSDMLLYAYRFFSYRRTPGQPSGGWENPLNPNKGSFLGHYLSACAQAIAVTSDAELKKKAEEIVADLRQSQLTYGGKWVQASGPERVFVLEGTRKGDDDFAVITAPYYPYHKLLMGLLDMKRLAGSDLALTVAKGLADFMVDRSNMLDDAKLQKILEREHGGIEEAFFQIYSMTKSPKYLKMAKRFEHLALTSPLAKEEDKLADLHANTQLPKLIGEARRYEITGEERSRGLVEYAWRRIAETRSYCTGSSSSKEYWRAPNALKDTLCNETEESCVTYNWIKLTRHLFEWSGDPKYGQMLETSLYNGILPAQNPSTGMFVYFMPLTKCGAQKAWGTPTDSFWCCYGTMVESFSSLVDNAYFSCGDLVVVNLYMPSSVEWKGVRMSQTSDLTQSDKAAITINTNLPKKFNLVLRVPDWAGMIPEVRVNGKAVNANAVPGKMLSLDREWKDGDQVEFVLPMSLSECPINDDPNLVAIKYGPFVLAGLTEDEVRLSADAIYKAKLVYRAPCIEFEIPTSKGPIRFVPLYKVIDEKYGVYFEKDK